MKFFFTEELDHFLGHKNQKNIFLLKKHFFQNYFCAKICFSNFVFFTAGLTVVTFWGKIIIQKNIFFQFCFLLKNLVTFWRKKLKKKMTNKLLGKKNVFWEISKFCEKSFYS